MIDLVYCLKIQLYTNIVDIPKTPKDSLVATFILDQYQPL